MNTFTDHVKDNRTKIFRVLFFVLLNIFALHASAAMVWGSSNWGEAWDDVDTDSDGLKDSEETNVYYTNPKLADTDHDTLPDGWEVTHSRNPLRADYQVSAGNTNTCALDDIGVHCWGLSSDGENNVPSLVNPLQISTGGSSHSCALDDTGAGTLVKCWGLNAFGDTDVPTLVNPRQVSAGTFDSCALDDTGVVCWGYNFGAAPALTNPAQVSAGGAYACALDDNGVHCWGIESSYGVLVVPVLTNPRQISAGNEHVCALDDNGVHCWGRNDFGQSTVPALVNPVQVSVGVYHTCALDDSGVHCWGNNGGGQTNVPTLNHPAYVSAGGSQTCALDDIGVVCWGDSTYGQAGVPTLTIDPDSDGAPSWWEVKYGLNRLDASDATSDLDGDGISNYQEYLRGTDPTSKSIATNDFGSDHKADVLLRNTSTGEWNLAQLNGLSVLNQGAVGAFTDIENVVVSTADFNGDGKADILTRGTVYGFLPGTFLLDLMDGSNMVEEAWIFSLSIDLDDEVVSTKDFNKDGKADVLLRNKTTGVWTMNYMNGTSGSTTVTLNASTDLCYSFKGDGDYDGNGYPDLLLRKDVGGACGTSLYPWLVVLTDGDSTILSSGVPTGLTQNINWAAFVADKDFNGDGKSDVLTRAQVGSVQQWLLYDMNGTSAPTSNALNVAVQSMWQFAGDGDFNGDSKSDLLLRNTNTGQWFAYTLDNVTILSAAAPNTYINLIWNLQAMDDYNGDGKSDILLRNSADGKWYMNLMNGTTVQSKGVTPITADLGYVLQND